MTAATAEPVSVTTTTPPGVSRAWRWPGPRRHGDLWTCEDVAAVLLSQAVADATRAACHGGDCSMRDKRTDNALIEVVVRGGEPARVAMLECRRRYPLTCAHVLTVEQVTDRLIRVGSHERAELFEEIDEEEVMTDVAYWTGLAWTWTGDDGPGYRLDWYLDMFTSPRPARAAMMNTDERAALDGLPPTVEVYRGVCHPDPACHRGLAWTLDRERAQWFADRFACLHEDAAPIVLEQSVDRSEILAYFAERQEAEVIVPALAVPNGRSV